MLRHILSSLPLLPQRLQLIRDACALAEAGAARVPYAMSPQMLGLDSWELPRRALRHSGAPGAEPAAVLARLHTFSVRQPRHSRRVPEAVARLGGGDVLDMTLWAWAALADGAGHVELVSGVCRRTSPRQHHWLLYHPPSAPTRLLELCTPASARWVAPEQAPWLHAITSLDDAGRTWLHSADACHRLRRALTA